VVDGIERGAEVFPDDALLVDGAHLQVVVHTKHGRLSRVGGLCGTTIDGLETISCPRLTGRPPGLYIYALHNRC